MAESIYKLFDYESPAALRSNYLKGITSPTSGGDLYSQLAQAGTNTGALLGYGLGRMFGYDAPGVNKAQAIDQIMSEAAKGENPLAQAKMAYELFSAQGMGREAQITMERLQELQQQADKRQFDIGMGEADLTSSEGILQQAKAAFAVGDRTLGASLMKDYASAKAAEKTAAEESNKLLTKQADITRNTKTITRLTPDIDSELASGIAADPDLYKEYVKEVFKTNQTKNNVSFQKVNGNVEAVVTDAAGNILKRTVLGAAPSEAPKVSISLDQKGQGKYAETVGTEVAKEDVAFVNTSEKAAESLPKIDQTLTLLSKGDVTTGIGAELLLNVNRVRSQFLRDKKAGKNVTDTQVLDALLGSEVFPMIDALGIGARGLDTPAEREYLRGVFTGTIQMDKNTLIELTRIRKNVAERALNKYNKRLSEGYFKNYEEALGRKLSPLGAPASTGAPTTSKGTKYQIIEE
jgi:hypothetical protein